MATLTTTIKTTPSAMTATLLANWQEPLLPFPKRAFSLYSSKVVAGFPSPADDYIESTLDLNDYLIKHPSATFMVRAQGDSMKDSGIQSGDLLIVDRSIEPTHGKIVIAAINGELTVKQLSCRHGKVQLMPSNRAYAPIDITEELELVIWGVVTNVIHHLP